MSYQPSLLSRVISLESKSISGAKFPIVATEDIPAFLPVTSTGKMANSANNAHRGKVVGLNTESVMSGFVAQVQESGEIVNPLWSWTNGDLIFINGTNLSTSAPTTGWSQSIGVAKGPTSIVIALTDPVLL
jgi:hypothetical protein